MGVDGWNPDPYGVHEERLFAHGEPTPVVRDQGIGSLDAPPVTGGVSEDAPAAPAPEDVPAAPAPEAGAIVTTGSLAAVDLLDAPSEPAPVGPRPTKPLVKIAGLLIGAGVIVGILGLIGAGDHQSATPSTTVNPLVNAFLHLPPATTPVLPAQTQSPPTTATVDAIERALQALPHSTTTVPKAPPATSPPTTKAHKPATASKGVAAVSATASRPLIVPTTTLPVTTMTTSVGQADAGWYLAYGSVFNTLQTDVEKINWALDSSQDPYPSVHPYWQELVADVGYAISLPPIPDAGSQAQWALALGDLSAGSAESIEATAGASGTPGFIQATFDQGTAFITTGTTQMDQAIESVEGVVAATSVASRNQVRAWNQSHAAVFSSLQTDISKLNTAMAASSSPDFAAVDPSWQQLLSDAQSAIKLSPIPDPVIESYWSTALNDLIQGSSDTIESSEALPPSLFDQGIATIETGATYLTTSVQRVQALVG